MTNIMKCSICNNQMILDQKDLYDDRYGARGTHDIYKCSTCGYGITSPGLKRKEIGKFYADHYPLSVISPAEIRTQIRILSPLLAWIEGVDNTAHWYVKGGEKALDIGSASGISLLEIEALGGIAYGVEPDPHGKKLAEALHLKVFKGFITDNPFPKIKFDLISASQVIEHEPEPLKFLLAIKKKLAKNGRVVLSFPNYNAIYKYIFGKRWIHWHIPYHLNFFTLKSFALLADQVGLKITLHRTITPNLWTIIQLRSMITKVSEGVKNPIWVQAKGKTKSKSAKVRPTIVYRILQLLARLSVWIVMPINRVIDSLGYGESFLIILEKKNKL